MESKIQLNPGECLLQIVQKAHEQKKRNEEVGVTDVLKAYDNFLGNSNMQFF